MAPIGSDPEDLEQCYRLEVSGTRTVEVQRRLRAKVVQAQRGRSNIPAIAAVLGFAASVIVIQTVEEGSRVGLSTMENAWCLGRSPSHLFSQ